MGMSERLDPFLYDLAKELYEHFGIESSGLVIELRMESPHRLAASNVT